MKMLKYLPILKLFEKQKEITRSDVEEALGVGTTHAVNLINEMQAKDLLVFTEYKYLKDVVGDEYKFYMNEDCDVVYYKLGQ
ncbi:hypothetical protein [Acetoanaerobium noterae]|uniref:hypothetical protein n=1 Tax=Acetoanaerobium noterae TaxID=745369 RepID=UPI003EB8233A